MRSMPIAEDVAASMHDESVVFVGVHMDTPDAHARVQEVPARNGISATLVLDPRHAISDAQGVLGTPQFVIID